MRKRVFLYHILPIGLYVCLVLLFLLSLSISKRQPEILSISPEEVRSGDLMIISGRNFGMTRNQSRVWLDESVLPVSAVEFWSDTTIKVRIPTLSGSGLIFLETPGGRSDGTLYILSERLPDRSSGAFLPGKPYLSGINSSRFRPGELVILNGDKLGRRQKNSLILVNLTAEAPESVLDTPDEAAFLPVPQENIYNWTDDNVAFYLPEEARSGPLYIRTASGYSNPVSIEVEEQSSYGLSEKREMTLSQKILISRVGALPGNSLVLWVPSPAQYPGRTVLEEKGSLEPLRRDGNIQLIRLDELASGHEYELEFSYKLVSSRIESSLKASDVSLNYDNLEMMDKWLEDSEDIPASYFTRTSSTVVKRERNPYRKASLIYDYILWRLSLDTENPGPDYTMWVNGRKADTFGYAAFFTSLARAAGVPARIVSGVWFPPESTEGVNHYWSEVYFPGTGWFPVDCAAADGAFSSLLPEGADPPGGWGFLDSGYIPFSRGNLEVFPFSEESERIDFRTYSQQNMFEEWIGNLDSCSIKWENIAIIEE